MEVLLGLSLALLGVVAGIYVSTSIHDHRIGDLSAAQFTAMHQMRDKTFRQVMPVLGLTNLALVLLSVSIALAAGVPRLLGVAAAIGLLIDIAITLTRQLPLNQQIQSWSEGAVPPDWAIVRDRWTFHHNIRAIFGVAAYVCFLAAVFLSIAR